MPQGRDSARSALLAVPTTRAAARKVLDADAAGEGERELKREVERLRALLVRLLDEVAELRRREAQAQRLADRDSLTGAFNRRWLLEHLPAVLAEAERREERVGVLFVDLDHFKEVNDTHGHATGDALLAAVSARIVARLRATDRVCRYGGDEFVVVLPRLARDDAALRVAAGVARRIAVPYFLDGVEYTVTASIGSAVYPRDARTAAALLHRADQSMYESKAAAHGGAGRAAAGEKRATGAAATARRAARRPSRRRHDPPG